MTNKHKILINNVVPLNNGDVALVFSLYKQLIDAGFQVEIAAYRYSIVKDLYPNLPIVPELGQSKIYLKLPFLKPLFLPLLFLFSKHYRKADVIIGAPGGYVNSYYKLKNSLSIYKWAAKFGKKTAIYAQSVGPLNERDSRFFSTIMAKSLDFILVRDLFSENVMKNLKIDPKKYLKTKDAAFLLDYKKSPVNELKKIAFSVREWKSDGRSIETHKNMIKQLVKTCIDLGYRVDFLSTCQGIPSYKDDSILANEIFQELEGNYKENTTVLSDYYSFDNFYKKLEDYELVVGTRLHMCITALTKMIPAFNISYEVKGKECYNYLELMDYSIDYNEPIKEADEKFRVFIKDADLIREKLAVKIPAVNAEVKKDFDYFIQQLI